MKNKKDHRELKFYEFSQNNSGGSFVVDDKVCHRLFVEAESEDEANSIAENLGCYWNGVDEGSDCPCCGDRWYSGYPIDLESRSSRNWPFEMFVDKKKSEGALESVIERYKGFEWNTPPKMGEKYGAPTISGSLKIRNIEQYAQLMADLYGWTYPDARIFYKNGEVKEIFSIKVEEPKQKDRKPRGKVNKIG